MPVDVYIGGDEHNTLHLLYSRFIYLFLRDIGAVPPEIPEPYQKRLSHGVILGADGLRMSKSKGNGVVPGEYVEKYGADTLRVYLLFMGPYDASASSSASTASSANTPAAVAVHRRACAPWSTAWRKKSAMIPPPSNTTQPSRI